MTGRAEVERETASWVHWYNTTRIHHSIGKMSPIEFEEQFQVGLDSLRRAWANGL